MKRFLSMLLVLSLAFLATPALAEEGSLILSATVEGRTTVTLSAPASGALESFTVREGDILAAGETVFTVAPKRVYADIDGTVADIYVAAGDIADAAVDRYGAVLWLERADRYEINASTRSGYSSVENRNLYVGTPVYLRSANENHFADGVITAVNGASFTVQVLGGDLVYTQDVKVYREEDYNSKTLLARASLSAIQPYAVTASGTITDVAVKRGDEVSAGDYLFSYVPDALDPELRGAKDATNVTPAQDLIVTAVSVQQGASVQKDQVLLSGIPAGEYQLVTQVEEGDVAAIAVGDTMTLRFEELDIPAAQATVTAISPLGTNEDISRYTVYLSFEAVDGVWPGMHAMLEK